MRLILDRWEEDKAVCEQEDGHTIILERSALSSDAAPGCVLVQDAGGAFHVDVQETEKRKQRIYALQQKLFRK